MRKSLASILLLLCFCGMAQKYVAGYVIDNHSNTSFIDVLYQSNDSRFELCSVREANGLIKEFRPEDIKGYGFVGGKFYSSLPDKSSFAEVLVKGRMNLWKSKSILRIFNDENLIDVNEENFDQLRSLFSSCESLNISDLELSEAELIIKTINFNECMGSSSTSFKELTPTMQFEVGPQLFYVNASHSFSGTRSFFYLDKEISSKHFQYGVNVNFSLPKRFIGPSVELGLLYSKSNFYQLYVEETTIRTNYVDLQMNYSSVGLPFSLKYTLQNKKIRAHIHAGLNYQIIVSQNVIEFRERVQGNEVFTDPEEIPFSLKNSMGYFWGLGVGKNLGIFNLDLYIRSTTHNSAISEENSRYRMLTIGLAISKAYKII